MMEHDDIIPNHECDTPNVKVTGSGAMGLLMNAGTMGDDDTLLGTAKGSTVLDAACKHLKGLISKVHTRESAIPDAVMLELMEAAGCETTDRLAVRTMSFIVQQAVERIALKAEALQHLKAEDYLISKGLSSTLDEEMLENNDDMIDLIEGNDDREKSERSLNILSYDATVNAIISENTSTSFSVMDPTGD